MNWMISVKTGLSQIFYEENFFSGVRHYKTFNTLPKDLTSFYKVAAMKYPYEETSSTVLPSAPDLKKPSPVKRNALTGTLEPRTPRPGIKKSNEVTHHIQKPDWMANLPIPQALRSTLVCPLELLSRTSL